ncbi:complement decay-accelerating factor isoform X2 [Misgurnus anguillicaudatus]|uniref:complement decay-accelerating factor isoform X2 n=1 Tax=Misgurnus anguillicaudatus TaxID=75329 RepID=UPI003CCF5020
MTNAKTWLLLLLYALVSMVKADCPSPVLNTTYLLSDKSLLQNSFPDNSKAFLQCANGYIFESGSTSILCTDGNWSEVELKCKKKDCGVPNASANMTYIISKGTLFGEYAQPKCDKGYRLQGSSYRQCLVHGWTGRAKCILITCDQPADIEHGKILTKVNPIFVDQVIEFSCDAGYVLVGEKNITCDEYGEYSSPPPTCEDIDVHTRASITSIPATTTISYGSREEEFTAYPSRVIAVVVLIVLAVSFICCVIFLLVRHKNKHKGSYNTGEERRTKEGLLLSQSKLKVFPL